MSDTADKLSFAGEINVLQASIISHAGKTLDITAIIADITIYEDLFSNTLSGYVIVNDGLDIVNNLPLIGQELFVVELQTPSLSTSIKKTFYVYKMQHRTAQKRSQTYMLNFCSLESITSINSKVAKAYDKPISSIVSSIFTDDKYLASKTKLNVENTANSIKFVAPFWSPLETINWLATKSISPSGAANYLFFENNQNFEYTSISSLMKAPSSRKYIFGDIDSNTAFGATNNLTEKYMMVQSMDTAVTFDYLRNTAGGMHASTLYTLDTTMKTIRKSSLDYLGNFSSTPHLEKNPLRTSSLVRKKLASIYFLHKNDYLPGHYKPMNTSKFFGQRNMLLEQLSAFRFTIKVFGRTDIRVGQVIDFSMMEMRQILKDEIDTTGRNDYFNGRYLITAIRHQIINGKHSMEMEIISDSFIKQIV